MKKISVFCVLLCCCSRLFAQQAAVDTVIEEPVPNKASTDSIVSVVNMASRVDSLKYGDVIEIKVTPRTPVSLTDTLYINGIAIPGLKAWRLNNHENTIYFRIGSQVKTVLGKILRSESSKDTVNMPVNFALGMTAKTFVKSSETLVMTVGRGIDWYWIAPLALVLLALIIAALYFDVLKDDNNLYYSLGRSQLFFWTVIIASCYIYLCSRTGSLPFIPESALIILGISAGTTAFSTMIGPRVSNGTVVIQPGAHSEGFLLDILSDGSSVNIHRFQNVVFNIIFGVVFIQQVVDTSVLPAFDSSMLILMGISSGTYAGLKVTEATKPQAELPPPTLADGMGGDPPPPMPQNYPSQPAPAYTPPAMPGYAPPVASAGAVPSADVAGTTGTDAVPPATGAAGIPDGGDATTPPASA